MKRHENGRPFNLAYVVSHPIQYQAPLLKRLAEHPDLRLRVFFMSDFSVSRYRDPGFETWIEWDTPLLEGYEYEFLPALGGNQKLTRYRPWSTGLTRALRDGGFDAVWVHGYAHSTTLRVLILAKTLGLTTMVRGESHLRLERSRTRVVRRMLLPALFRSVDAFLAIGTWNADFYRAWGVGDSKIFHVPYAVDNRYFQAAASSAHEEREVFRQGLGLEPGRPIILYASKLEERKRPADLLAAYRGLSEDGTEPDPYLLFVGEGEQRRHLEEQAASVGWSSIRFLGFRNQSELPAFYDLCDVFVLPSEREPWGLVINEVMNCSKPAIVTDQVGAAGDLVLDGHNGFVIRVGDVAALTERLADLINDPERGTEMGRRSLEIITRWDFVADANGILEALHSQQDVRPTPA